MFLKYDKNIQDCNIDLFMDATIGNTEIVKSSLNNGADPRDTISKIPEMKMIEIMSSRIYLLYATKIRLRIEGVIWNDYFTLYLRKLLVFFLSECRNEIWKNFW